MYKLLLVTDQQSVLEAFGAVTNWELQGFRTPRTADTAAGAVASLQKHHADGIAISLPDQETSELLTYLTEHAPMLPIMHAGHSQAEVLNDVRELRHLLGRVNADNSNDRYDQAEAMQRVRHAFFRELINGRIKGREAVLRQLQLLRSRMDPTQHCVMISFQLPEDDGYLAGRWHYGPDRLEIAMRNLFGAELAGLRLLVSVLDEERIYLLACPMIGCQAPSDEDAMTAIVTEHAQDAIVHVHNYLGIEMRISSVSVLPSVTVLAEAEDEDTMDL